MGCHALLQGIFLTQGSNRGLWEARNRKHIVAKPNLATEHGRSELKHFRLAEELALFFLIQHFILWQKQFRLLKESSLH